MKAVVYSRTGAPDVLHLAQRPVPEPGPGQVRVRIAVSGVNPTDIKSRQGAGPGQATPFAQVVPGQDGAGTISALGVGVPASSGLAIGTRVWVWEAAWARADGTCAQEVVLPVRHVVPLPNDVSFDIGASLGIPALTAHRCLTVAEGGPTQLSPGALSGVTVLVAGGAGAVGHAAIQLARWAGARVITTVSSPAKGDLAVAAGAHHVVNYRTGDAGDAIASIAPEGVDVVVEVAPGPNAGLDTRVTAPGGTIAIYANDGGPTTTLPVRESMTANTRVQFVFVYTVDPAAKDAAVAAVRAAVADGALDVGEGSGLPLHRFTLAAAAAAHAAVEAGVTGKVLIDVGGPGD